MKNKYTFLVLGLMLVFKLNAQQIATIDDLTLSSESYWNGSDGSGSFTSGPANFRNNYNADWMSWSGFAYSNITDHQTAGYNNQYSAITGNGVDSSANYAVGYVFGADTIDLNESSIVLGVYITNSTYAALSMRNGDGYSKKFGGTSGNDADWFKLTVTGWNNQWQSTGSVDFYLADYRFADNSKDYIVDTWEWLSLEGLSQIEHLTFSLSSSDNGTWGMNTPAYFCLDNLTTVNALSTAGLENLTLNPESFWEGNDLSGGFKSGNFTFPNHYNSTYFSWTGWAYSNRTDTVTTGWNNQYSSYAGQGAEETKNYAVSYHYLPNTLILNAPTVIYGTYLTNSSYAALSMRNGDDYSKKFGGISGNDPDYFKLTITGKNVEGEVTGTIDFYLADYRFEDNSKDYIVKDWKWINLSSLGKVKELSFELSSTDNGDWGMNTPSYFCMDEIKYLPLTTKNVAFNVTCQDKPVSGIEVKLGESILTTDINGKAIFESVSPTADVAYQMKGRGYKTLQDTVDIFENIELAVSLETTPVDITFVVTDGDQSIYGAQVTIGETKGITNNAGEVILSVINPSDAITFSADKEGYSTYQGTVNAFKDSVVNITMLYNSIKGVQDILFAVFPNPFNEILNIEAETGSTIIFTDLSGKLVYKNKFTDIQTTCIETSTFKSGFYLIQVQNGNYTRIQKIIKQ